MKRFLRSLRLPAAVIAFFCSAVAAGAAQPPMAAAETGLMKADADRFAAMVARDIPALSRLLADELVYVHSSSTRQSKSEHLGDTEAGRAVYQRIDAREQQPRVYGDVGVIQGIATFTTGGRQQQTFTLRYTDVYVMRDSRWQMVAWHCTRIPEP